MKIIINRTANFGTIDGVIKPNNELLSIVFKALKAGKAELMVDTNETLMYIIR